MTFHGFKEHYLDNKLFDDTKLPPNCDYLGMDLSNELLCLDHQDKNIYLFGNGKRLLWYYGGLTKMLFYYLFNHIENIQLFDSTVKNVKIYNMDKFKQTYLAHELKNVQRGQKYFFKQGKLVVCLDGSYRYHCYQGGILSHLNCH